MQNDNVIRVKPDTLIAMAVMEAEALDMSRLPSLQQMNKEFDPSEAFCKRMERLMAKTRAKEKFKESVKKAKKYTLAFTVLCTLFFGALLPAHAVQTAIVQTVQKWYDGFTGWFYASDTTYAPLPIDFILTPVPKGFTLVEQPQTNGTDYFASYKNDTGKCIFIRVLGITAEQFDTFDNEQTDVYSVTLGNINATLEIERGSSDKILFWQEGNLLFKIYGTANTEDLLWTGSNIIAGE